MRNLAQKESVNLQLGMRLKTLQLLVSLALCVLLVTMISSYWHVAELDQALGDAPVFSKQISTGDRPGYTGPPFTKQEICNMTGFESLFAEYQLERRRAVRLTKNSISYDSHQRYGVVGILSAAHNQCYRMAQRLTFIPNTAETYHVKVYFLIDRPHPSLQREQELYRDILYLNATYSGRAVRFGEKLALWFQLARKLHPDAAFVAKMDDDCVLCNNVLWPFVWQHVAPDLYLGRMDNYTDYVQHGASAAAIRKFIRHDELFVVLGMELIERITDRRYCHHNNVSDACDPTRDLFDTGFGGTSLGTWLEAYDDFTVVTFQDYFAQHRPFIESLQCNGTMPYAHPIKDPLQFARAFNRSGELLPVATRAE